MYHTLLKIIEFSLRFPGVAMHRFSCRLGDENTRRRLLLSLSSARRRLALIAVAALVLTHH